MGGSKNQNKKTKKIIYYSMLAFFAVVFIVSAVYIGKYVFNSVQNGNKYGDLQQQVQQHQSTAPSRPIPTAPTQSLPDPTTGTEPTETTEPTEPQILAEYQGIYNQNTDMVGWINVPNTRVNYPVMQSPSEPDFYLTHSFDRTWNAWGAIYVREACDVFAPSVNLVLYGHHMQDGSMFTGLDAYKKKSYWEGNQLFTFDTLYEHHTYQIFAAFRTSADLSIGYPYHQFNDTTDPAEFDDFVNTVKKLSYYDTGITPKFGDKLITLSTCEYTLSNGRFVVVGVRVS